jgi:hypothetical protein
VRQESEIRSFRFPDDETLPPEYLPCLKEGELRAVAQKIPDDFLVLFAQERTRRIEKFPARGNNRGISPEEIELQGRHFPHPFLLKIQF